MLSRCGKSASQSSLILGTFVGMRSIQRIHLSKAASALRAQSALRMRKAAPKVALGITWTSNANSKLLDGRSTELLLR